MAKKYKYNEARKEYYTLVYDGTFNPDGSKHRKRISSKKSSADLEKKVKAFKDEVEAAGAVRSNAYTFGEYAKVWFTTAKATREYNTRKMYDNVIRNDFSGIESTPLSQITHSHFQMCINAKQDKPRTCEQISLTFKQIIRSAVKDHYLPRTAVDDILTDISLPKYQKPQKRPLREDEKKAVMDADLDPKKRTYVSMIYYCGLRKSEALALTKEDFDFDNKTVSISKAWTSEPAIKPYPKSDNGNRVIPLPDAAISQIKPFVDASEGNIFRTKDKDIMTEISYRRMWTSIINAMNYTIGYDPQKKKDRQEKQFTDLTAHTFRHNYCTELCYQIPTISTKMIARLLGDSEKMVLEVYSHLVEEKESAVEAVNNIFQ